MTDPESLCGQMLDRLASSGELSSAWSEAFAAVPRHRFIPDTIWLTDHDGLVPLHRREDPQEWMRRAYASAAVVTQVDDGRPAGPGERGCYISSSASQPEVVALMLTALDAEPGMRVLEVGTGTGYNAALLGHRLGTRNVISVEIDPDLANHAHRSLTATGYPVDVITGDGALGYPPGAPYDRIISTAAVRHVPRPWVMQTRPGGTIVTPWGTPYHNGALVSFTVHGDGTAVGHIVGSVAFMRLRNQRFRATIDDERYDETTARHTHTTVAPYSVASDYDASLAIGMRVPNCTNVYVPAGTGSDHARLWFVDPTTESWANVVHRPGAEEYSVHQRGPRDLWDEVETAYRWWRDAGRPDAARWRITITPEGQQVILTTTGP
jgi:protein-L-isoaspartate(D-aspartate) O-methyltransferase